MNTAPPTELEQHRKKIIEAIRDATIKRQINGAEETWTESIKTALAVLGKELHFETYAHGVIAPVPVAWREWLWDIVWARQRAVEGETLQMATHLPMIGEIEWNTRTTEIMIDFQKLVFGLADLKVYIFRSVSAADNQRVLNLCKTLSKIESIATVGKYLLIGVPIHDPAADLFEKTW